MAPAEKASVMFSAKYRGYALVGLVLVCWSALIEGRNVNNPRVQHLFLERAGPHTVVRCDVWNPRYREIYVKALVRLIDAGNPHGGSRPVASPYHIVDSRIPPRSSLTIAEHMRDLGTWGQAEVRVLVINDPAEIAKIASATPRMTIIP